MASSINWTLTDSEMSSYFPNDVNDFYIYGMSSAAAAATITITGPHGKKWTFDTSDLVQGQVFNFHAPVNTENYYGKTSSSTPRPYNFGIEISSTATGSNEGIKITAQNSSSKSVMSVIQYNDPSNSDTDYNDVVLTIALFPG